MKSFKLALLPVIMAMTGCASIVNGSNQSISVETRSESGMVSGANCRLSNNKGTWFLVTPGSTLVNRSFEDLSVKCEMAGHEPGLLSVKSSTKAMAFGNIIFGGVIGAGVDMSTGAAYDYPTLITVVMGKAGTAGSPQVNTPPSNTPPAAPSGSTPPKQ
jgi:hypothetical protein